MLLCVRPRRAVICLLAALSGGRLHAQTSAATAMTGTVLTAITVSGSDLAFGRLLRTQTKRVAAPAGGRFTITMASSTPVTINYALPSALGANVVLSAWQLLSNTLNDAANAQQVATPANNGSFTASTPTGTLYLWVGATVATTNAAIGTYSQPITLTVTYN